MDFTLPVPLPEFLNSFEAAYVPGTSPTDSPQALDSREQAIEWRGKTVQQVDMNQLPEHTRDLLLYIMDKKSSLKCN